jgi:hypothetical protein
MHSFRAKIYSASFIISSNNPLFKFLGLLIKYISSAAGIAPIAGVVKTGESHFSRWCLIFSGISSKILLFFQTSRT